jgi:hypothetical protein
MGCTREAAVRQVRQVRRVRRVQVRRVHQVRRVQVRRVHQVRFGRESSTLREASGAWFLRRGAMEPLDYTCRQLLA